MDQLSQTHCVTKASIVSLRAQFHWVLNKMRERQVIWGLPVWGVPRLCWLEAEVGRLTDILVKTDSSRDRTDRYMHILWPP